MNIKNFQQFNEGILSTIFRYNKDLIERVKSCQTNDELFNLIEEIYPKTKSGLGGYPFDYINNFYDNNSYEIFKKSLIGNLSEHKLSDIIIYGPTAKKPGKGWFVTTSYMLMH